MQDLIVLDRIADEGETAGTSGTAALDFDADRCIALEFRFRTGDGLAIEAIRHARRAMLREEWTRGREPGEPSLQDAIFSAGGVVWTVPAGQRAWCLQKMDELIGRAERALATLGSART